MKKIDIVSLTDSEKKRIKKRLNSIITNCLGGPGGDPEDYALEAAADAFKLLEAFGLEIENEDDVRTFLTRENIYEVNFLA